MRTVIVIPAYNEEQRIGRVMGELVHAGYEVIVIDDASSDKTAEVAEGFPVYLSRQVINLGQGAALKTGTELAIKKGFEIIVHFDADGQHRIEDIGKLIETLKDNDLEIAIGSRFLNVKSELPLKKKIILGIAKIFSQKILKLKFSDPQSGLRVFKASVYKKIKWQHDDFQHCSEILGLILKNNVKYREVPIKVNYDRQSGSKKVKPQMRMGWKMLFGKMFE